jgi:hypothetical protein
VNPVKTVHTHLSVRRALTGLMALSLVALPACGDDEDDDDTPTESVVGSVLPVDTLAPTDTLAPSPEGTTATEGSTGATTPESMAPGETSPTDSTTAP